MRANVTRDAEGFDRRSFSVAEILRMQDAELWVIDAERRRTLIHSGPEAGAWPSLVERGPDEALTSTALPGSMSRLASI